MKLAQQTRARAPAQGNWRNTNAVSNRARAPMRERKSFGIACCRIVRGQPALVVGIRKRCSYAYWEFVHSKYDSQSDSDIITLLSNTCPEEKTDILSFDYNIIWYRAHLKNMMQQPAYLMSKNKFESAFGNTAGRQRLRRLIESATHGPHIWELPKGKKRNRAEPDINCAMREFTEETGIKKHQYKIFPLRTFTLSFIDDNVRYTSVYYLAIETAPIALCINLASHDQMEEVAEIRWMSIAAIREIDINGRMERLVRPMFQYARKYALGKAIGTGPKIESASRANNDRAIANHALGDDRTYRITDAIHGNDGVLADVPHGGERTCT